MIVGVAVGVTVALAVGVMVAFAVGVIVMVAVGVTEGVMTVVGVIEGLGLGSDAAPKRRKRTASAATRVLLVGSPVFAESHTCELPTGSS